MNRYSYLMLLLATAAVSATFAQAPGNANGPPMAPLPLGPDGKPVFPPQIVARAPTIESSIDAAKAIVASCQGFHVGVAILDAAGTPKLYYIPDGTAGTHAYTAFRKANTALAFNMPSEDAADRAKSDPNIAAKWQADKDNYVAWAGGITITVNGEVIGAVGVSGAEPSAKDKACALDGIRKIRATAK
jgi:uncharacterized protein GlcG (DUF336 family)